MRSAPVMPIQPQNIEYGNIARQIKALEPSEGYRNDFKMYLSILRDHDETIIYPSWYSLYVKMLWAMQAKHPETVNLKTITREQVSGQNLPCISVKAAVEDGLLRELPGYRYWDHVL